MYYNEFLRHIDALVSPKHHKFMRQAPMQAQFYLVNVVLVFSRKYGSDPVLIRFHTIWLHESSLSYLIDAIFLQDFTPECSVLRADCLKVGPALNCIVKHAHFQQETRQETHETLFRWEIKKTVIRRIAEVNKTEQC